MLREGARHYKVDPEYVKFLEGLEHQRSNWLHDIIGKIIFFLWMKMFMVRGFLLKKTNNNNFIKILFNSVIIPGIYKGSWVIRWFIPRFLDNVNKGVDISPKRFIPKKEK